MFPSLSPAGPRGRRVRSRARAAARVAALIVMVAGAATLGCAPDHTSRKLLVAPQRGQFSVLGQVRVTGRLADDTDGTLGTRVVDVANDVKIHIEGPGGYRDSVFTQSGGFLFKVDDPGLYRMSCCVVQGDTAGHIDVVVAGDDSTDAGMLAIGSPAGNITTYPNPFDATGVGVEATIAATQRIEVFITTLFGFRVWNYAVDNYPAGFLHIHWIGTDDDGHEVPDGLYWAVLHADGVYSYSLVFKETPAPARSGR